MSDPVRLDLIAASRSRRMREEQESVEDAPAGPAYQHQPDKPAKKKRRVLSLVLNTLVYAGIIAGVVYGLPRFLTWYLHTSYPMAAITSSSMWPALKEGDLVLIQGVKGKEDMDVGDIVVYRNFANDTLTIHRIVEMKEGSLITKGDANFKEDAPVEYGNVIGKTYTIRGYQARIPYLGSLTVFAGRFRQEHGLGGAAQ